MSLNRPIRADSNHTHIPDPLSPSFPIWSLGFSGRTGVFSQAEFSLCIIECVFPQLKLACQFWQRLWGEEASGIIDLIMLHLESCRDFGKFKVEYRGIQRLEDMPDGKVGERSVGWASDEPHRRSVGVWLSGASMVARLCLYMRLIKSFHIPVQVQGQHSLT